MINIAEDMEVINEKNGDQYQGNDIEYFIDDKTDIGEVYIDGNLIFQSDNIFNEEELRLKFKESFSIIKEESTDAKTL